jgi:phosphohistidine phosphatase
MKRITLLRHAKSSWQDSSLADRDRPLNKRGQRDAPDMGQRLKARGARPSLILTSPADRAKKTARSVARELDYPQEFIQKEDDLYLASPETLIAVVSRQENGFNDIMLVAHNPGITDLANRLGDMRIRNVPTCGVVAVDVDITEWTELAAYRGTTVFFDYPKKRQSVS